MTEGMNDPLRNRIIGVLRTIYDPEIPVDIVELGLVYEVRVGSDQDVHICMTLTSPACPVAGILVEQARSRVQELDGVSAVDVDLVWDPPWSPDRMSEAARLTLNLEPGDAGPRGGGTEFIGINKSG